MNSAKRDAMRFACVFLLGTTLLSSYHYILATYGDDRDLFSLSETGGPFSVNLVDGQAIRGAETGTFAPGQRVGWLSSLCVEGGVGYTAHVTMVRVRQDGVPEREVVSRSTVFQPSDRRCGPRVFALTAPEDAVPGQYELRRWLDFRVGTWWPLHAKLPPIVFRLAGGPGMPGDANP